jgi:flagellar assembly protein FliH
MDSFIPKEKLTAYQRWELAAFDEQQQEAAAAASAPAASPEPAEPAPAPPSAEELQRIFAAAREAGHQAGYEAGFQAGQQAGLDIGQQAGFQAAQELAGQMAAVAIAFQEATQALEGRVAEELLDLALHVARQVVRGSLRGQPELVLDVVREAMLALPSLHGHPTLMVHPEDAPLVRTHLAEQIAHTGWRLVEDPTLERGGCRVENGSSEIDATVATRWKRIVESIGSRSDWLEKPQP